MSAVESRGGSALQLTVAVPAYNVESYLARGLESYLDPRFVGKLEVVVVDESFGLRITEIVTRDAT